MPTALQIVQKFYPNVQSVRDSKKTLVLEVTKKDTQSSAVKNHKECALAVACRRALNVDAAIICVKTAYLIKDNKAVRYQNPESVSREVMSFDRNAGFEPGVYALNKVPPSCELMTKRSSSPHTKRGKAVHYHRTENIRIIE